jgi:hypothetical protein
MVLQQRFAERERAQQRNSEQTRLIDQLTSLDPDMLMDLLNDLKGERAQESRDAEKRTGPQFFEDDPL